MIYFITNNEKEYDPKGIYHIGYSQSPVITGIQKVKMIRRG